MNTKCTMDVGCYEHGICYAQAQGESERCPRAEERALEHPAGCTCMEIYGEDPECVRHGHKAVFYMGARSMRNHLGKLFKSAGCDAIASKVLCVEPEDCLGIPLLTASDDVARDLLTVMLDLFENPQFQVSIGGNPIMVEALMRRVQEAIGRATGAA